MATISSHNFWCSLLGIFNSLCKKCCTPGRFWRVREECFSCSELGPIKGSPKKLRHSQGLVTFSCSPSATSPGVLDKWCSSREHWKSLARKGKHFSTNIHFNKTLEMTKPGEQDLSITRMWRSLHFTSQTKRALENSFPSMKNVSSLRAIFSHPCRSIPPFHLSTWLTENRQAIKNTSTSNHGDNVPHYSPALSQRPDTPGRKRRGEDKDWAGGQERNWNWKRETLSLIQKCAARSGGLTRPSSLVVELLYCLHSMFSFKIWGLLGYFCCTIL